MHRQEYLDLIYLGCGHDFISHVHSYQPFRFLLEYPAKIQAHCDVLRVFVIFPLTTPEKGVLKFIVRFVSQPQRHLQQAY